ncbi:MAG: ABC transporter ATP-binding protein [Deinococcales bacterium]|nr:ABC transporter ATP-binding protein [Deinococcales bacterium]
MADIHVSGLSKAYPLARGGERLALEDVDLRIDSGEFVCLLGPSGCGKTTLLNILAGLDRPDAGSVRVGDPDTATAVTSYVFQEPRLLPWKSVRANLRFVLDRADGADERIDYWLERVGLAGRGNDYPRQLSIGQRQRVAVARALLIEPDVLFMDEPFSALDELTASRMREELLGLWQELGCTVVFVTHNPMEAAFLADRIAIMSPGPGRIVREYRVSEALPRPRDADDARLWEVSRNVVSVLKGRSSGQRA